LTGSSVHNTHDIELAADVTRANDDLSGGSRTSDGSNTPIVGQVGEDETRGGTRGNVELHRGGVLAGSGNDVGTRADNGGGGGEGGTVAQGQGVGVGSASSVVNNVQVLRVLDNAGIEVGHGGDIEQERVLHTPGVGGGELVTSNRGRSSDGVGQVVRGQDVGELVIISSGGVQGQRDEIKNLRAVSTSIASITGAAGGVVGGDVANTSGSAVAARNTRSADWGRSPGVTSRADVHNTGGIRD